jgi:hypothetical protein
MPTTPRLLLPYPTADDTADVPRDILALATRLEAMTGWLRNVDFVDNSIHGGRLAGLSIANSKLAQNSVSTFNLQDGSVTADKIAAGVATPPLVDTLPGGSDGQEVIFQTAAMAAVGTAWHLRYRAASPLAYKWEFVGGAALYANVAGTLSMSTLGGYEDGASYVDLTVPASGLYDIYGFMRVVSTTTQDVGSRIRYSGGATSGGTLGGTRKMIANEDVLVIAQGRVTSTLAGARTYRMQHMSQTASADFSGRFMYATPVALGS